MEEGEAAMSSTSSGSDPCRKGNGGGRSVQPDKHAQPQPTLVLDSTHNQPAGAEPPSENRPHNRTIVLDPYQASSLAESLTGENADLEGRLSGAVTEDSTNPWRSAEQAPPMESALPGCSAESLPPESTTDDTCGLAGAIAPTGASCAEEALEWSGEAIEHEDKVQSPSESLQAAITAAQAGNRPLACLHLGKAIQDQPDNPICWLWLAWVSDSPTTAISALNQALVRAPKQPLLVHGLAWARAMQRFDMKRFVTEPDVNSQTSDNLSAAVIVSRHGTTTSASAPAASGATSTGSSEEERRTKTSVRGEGAVIPPSDPVQSAPTTDWEPEEHGTIATVAPSQYTAMLRSEPAENSPTSDGEYDDLGTIPTPVPSESNATPSSVSAEPAATSDREREQHGHSACASPETIDGAQQEQDTAAELTSLDSADRSPAGVATDFAEDAEIAMETASPSDQPTILAVDDSPTIRELVSMSLSKCGYNVVTASDGVTALKCITACKPALILMDIDMPRLNGYQLCKLVKKHKTTRMIPVIMLSGKDRVFDKCRGKLCGCNGYITKPFESAHLVKKVSAYLAKAQMKI
jgi:twitching motility two-component system response regulator PilG